MDEIANLLLGQIANKSITPTVDEHQISLAISQSAQHSETMPLSLGTQGTNLGVSLDANATVTGSLGIDFTLGVNLDAGVPDAHRFFVKFTKLQLGATIAASNVNATATLGPLDTAITRGDIALGATATLTVDNSADGVLTVAELQAATPATLFGTPALTSTLHASLPLDIQLNSVPLPGGQLKLDSADLFGNQLNLSFAGITYDRDVVDVDTNGDNVTDLDDVTATTLALTLTQPIAFNGFTLNSGTVVVAMIAANGSRYFAGELHNLTGGLDLGTVSAHLTGVEIGINVGGLDWGAIDRDETGAFTKSPIQVNGEDVNPGPGALKISGALDTLNLANLVSGAAHFAAQVQGDLTTFALDNLNVSIGAGTDGLQITSGKIGLARLAGGDVA